MLPFILEPRQAPILTAGSEAGTKQGITFPFTAEKAARHSWPEASSSSSSSSSHPARLILLIDLFGM